MNCLEESLLYALTNNTRESGDMWDLHTIEINKKSISKMSSIRHTTCNRHGEVLGCQKLQLTIDKQESLELESFVI